MTFRSFTLGSRPKSNLLSRCGEEVRGSTSSFPVTVPGRRRPGLAVDAKKEAGKTNRRTYLFSWGSAERACPNPANPLLRSKPDREGRQIQRKIGASDQTCTSHCLGVMSWWTDHLAGSVSQGEDVTEITQNPQTLSPLPPPAPPSPSLHFSLPPGPGRQLHGHQVETELWSCIKGSGPGGKFRERGEVFHLRLP